MSCMLLAGCPICLCCLCRCRRPHQLPAQISLVCSCLTRRLCIRLNLAVAEVGSDVGNAAEARMDEGERGGVGARGERCKGRGGGGGGCHIDFCFCFCFLCDCSSCCSDRADLWLHPLSQCGRVGLSGIVASSFCCLAESLPALSELSFPVECLLSEQSDCSVSSLQCHGEARVRMSRELPLLHVLC